MKAPIILLSILLVANSACQQESSQEAPVIAEQPLAPPTVLPLIDGICPEGLPRLTGLPYWSWDGSSLRLNQLTDSTWRSERSLQSRMIFTTLFGFQESNLLKDGCEDAKTLNKIQQRDCVQSSEVVSTPQNLKICPNQDFQRPSIEAASLSVVGAFSSISNFVDRLDLSLSPLALMMLPDINFRSQDGAHQVAAVDNAGWVLSNRFAGIPAYLVFYPMSSRYLATDQAPFWEVPWIVSHEYGHHVFYNLLTPEIREHFGYLSQLRTDAHLHSQWLVNQAPASANDQKSFTSLNEAFADLFAHYSMAGNSRQMSQLNCRFQHRDVANPRLNNGREKSFNIDDTSTASDPCSFVDYGAVHVKGAVVAYFIDQYYKLGGITSIDQKAKSLLTLVRKLALRLESNLQQGSREHLFSSIVVELADSLDEPNAAQCQLIDDTFAKVFSFPFTMSDLVVNCRP